MDKIVEKAYFACGCFWGTEFYFSKAPGVEKTNVGYMGGEKDFPTYGEVRAGNTGHFETIEVVFDPAVTNYEALIRLFFEIHDFTQTDGQGPDIGSQYLSAIFYATPEQEMIASHYKDLLKSMDYVVATTLRPISQFWPGEGYHQHYYDQKGETPYCHMRRRIFK